MLPNREWKNAKQREYYYARSAELNAATRADRAANPEKYRERERRYHSRDPRVKMLSCAKLRSKQDGLPFDITKEDIVIPNFCPILGIELKVAAGNGNSAAHSPSLDKLIPELGYVRGNVAVISSKANSIKNSATPEELMAVAQWVRAQYPQWLLTS